MLTSKDFQDFQISEIKNTNKIVGGAFDRPSLTNTKEYTSFLGFIWESGSHADTIEDGKRG